jgi:PAS domain S-box-containing protein
MKRFNKVILGLKSGISRRLIIYILLFSMVITIIGTGLKLYLDFNQEIKSIHTTFEQIESSYKSSIINSLWVTDNELLYIQLEGMLQLQDIQFIEIRKGAEVLQAVGTHQSESILEYTIPLVYVYNGKDVHLGDMHIVASLKAVYSRIFDRILVILSMQTINIFLVSLFIFILFYQLVGKHIISMASFAKSIRFDSSDQMFQLDRKLKTKKPDELEELVTSFNLMRKNLARDIKRREIVEKELQESEERFRTISENAPVLINSFDTDGRCLFWNKQCNKTFGWTIEEINEHEVAMELFYPDPAVREEVVLSITTDPIGSFREWNPVTKDGKILSIMWANFRLPNGQIFSMGYDITDRKQTEKALKESEEQLRIITDNLPVLISQIDKDLKYTYANKYYYDIGELQDSMIGKNVADVIGKETFNRSYPNMQKALSGERVSFENRYLNKKNNKLLIMESHFIPYVVNDQVESFFVLAVDITERKLGEEALHKYEHIVSSSTDMLAFLDKQYTYLAANKEYLKVFDLTTEKLIGKTVAEVFGKDFFNTVIKLHADRCLAGEEVNYQDWFDFPSTGKCYMDINYHPYYADDKQILGFVVNGRNITDRKQAEEELIESNEKYLDLMDSLGTGVVLHGSDTSILLSNPKASEILGISPEQMKGKKAIDPRWRFVRNDGTDMPLEEYPVNKALRSMKSFSEYFIGIKRPDRKYITWVNVNASLVFDDNNNIKYVTISFNDTTEQKQAEDALQKSEERFRNLFETMSHGVVYQDSKGIIIDANPSAQRILGLSLDQMQGRKSIDPRWKAIHEDGSNFPGEEHPVMIALKSGKDVNNVIMGVYKPSVDEYRWINVNAILQVYPGENKPHQVYSIFEDITERKLAEEALKESEEKFKKIFKLSPVIMTLTDIETGVYLDVNEMFSSKLGFTQEEVIGVKSTDLDLFMSPSAREDIIRLFNEQGFILNHEFQLRRKSGSIFHSIFSSYILELKDKKVMLTTAIDITDRKQVEEALKESEAKLNALFTSLTEMVVMHELLFNDADEAIDYRIIDCNKVFTELTGIRKEDAIGKLASEVYQTNPPPYLEEYAKVALGGNPHEFTTYYPPLEKHLMISVVSPQAGKFATITTDISDMMQIQEMIIAKNKEMENYLYVASHDLRTPLVNIQGFSQRLKKQADSIKTLFADKRLEPETLHQLATITDENIPKTLSFILGNIEKMDALINGLLRLSRTGTVEMNIQKIDMNELFAKILQSLDFQIKEAQCKINIDSLPECYGDAALLDQLFANIISNALKYSDSERALEITVNAKNIRNRVVYTIRDTGKGIAQKHLEKIWDIFYRIDPRSGNSGEGLGLSLVKRIAEKHKGKAWAESEENKGSAFHIELHNSSFTEL